MSIIKYKINVGYLAEMQDKLQRVDYESEWRKGLLILFAGVQDEIFRNTDNGQSTEMKTEL